jgi:spore germination protein YaaH
MIERKHHIGAILIVIGIFIAIVLYRETAKSTHITVPIDTKNITEQKTPTPTHIPTIELSAWLPSFQEREALTSIGSASSSLSTILPEWYQLDYTGKLVTSALPVQTEIRQLAKEASVRIMPSVTANDPDRISTFLSHPDWIDLAVKRIAGDAKTYFYLGVDIRFDSVPATQAATFLNFVKAVQDALARQEQITSVTLPFKASRFEERIAAFPIESLSKMVDEIRLFLIPYAGSNAQESPPLSFNEISTILKQAKQMIPTDKLVIGLPVTAADWDNRVTVEHTYTESVDFAKKGKVELVRSQDTKFLTSTFLYQGLPHTVYIPDANTISQLVLMLVGQDVRKISLWYISGEDGALWKDGTLFQKK